jgi:hypothetical protein
VVELSRARCPDLVRPSCLSPWFLSSPPDLARLSLFSYFIFWPLTFHCDFRVGKPNLSRSDFVVPSILAAQRRSRSGLSSSDFSSLVRAPGRSPDSFLPLIPVQRLPRSV